MVLSDIKVLMSNMPQKSVYFKKIMKIIIMFCCTSLDGSVFTTHQHC